MRDGGRQLSHGHDAADVGDIGLCLAQGLTCSACSGDQARDEEREGDERKQRNHVGGATEDAIGPEFRGEQVRQAQNREDEDQQRRNETSPERRQHDSGQIEKGGRSMLGVDQLAEQSQQPERNTAEDEWRC